MARQWAPARKMRTLLRLGLTGSQLSRLENAGLMRAAKHVKRAYQLACADLSPESLDDLVRRLEAIERLEREAGTEHDPEQRVYIGGVNITAGETPDWIAQAMAGAINKYRSG